MLEVGSNLPRATTTVDEDLAVSPQAQAFLDSLPQGERRMLEVIPKPKPPMEELKQTLERAAARIEECDSVLIIMQKGGEGGMLWFAPDDGRVETASWLATSFLHWLHSRKESD